MNAAFCIFVCDITVTDQPYVKLDGWVPRLFAFDPLDSTFNVGAFPVQAVNLFVNAPACLAFASNATALAFDIAFASYETWKPSVFEALVMKKVLTSAVAFESPSVFYYNEQFGISVAELQSPFIDHSWANSTLSYASLFPPRVTVAIWLKNFASFAATRTAGLVVPVGQAVPAVFSLIHTSCFNIESVFATVTDESFEPFACLGTTIIVVT